MKIYKYCTLIVILMLLALQSKAQLPLRGTFYITGVSEIPSTTSSSYSLEGRFTDPTFTYSASDVRVGDNVVDNGGILYKIDKIRSLADNLLTVDVTYVRGASDAFFAYPTAFAAGVLFRPTPNGYALGVYDPENNSEVIKTAIQNSAIIDIDKDIRGFKSGTAVPEHPKYGDIFYNVTEKKLYAFTENGWVPLGSGVITSGTASEFPNPAKAGEMYLNKDDNNTYIYNGALWFKISTNGSTPSANVNPDPATAKVKEGDLFYNTSDHKLYVYNGSAWVSINNVLKSGQIFVGNASNTVTAVTMTGDAILTNIGKLTIKNEAVTDDKLDKLHIPLSGFAPPLNDVEMGDGTTNFRITNLAGPSNAYDAVNRDYVDKILSTPGSLSLRENNFFIGNSVDKAVAIDKSLIPISGFGRPVKDLIMGPGPASDNNLRITNLRDPGAAQDAATKNYVDTRPVAASSLVLAKGNIFIGGEGNMATSVPKSTVPLNTFGKPLDVISMAGFKLNDLGDPFAELDAVNKKYVDNKVINPGSIPLTTGNFFVGVNNKATDVLKNTIPLSGFGAATEPVSLNGFKLTNLAGPDTDGDAATKKYVDDLFKTPADLLALPVGRFFVGNTDGKAAATVKDQITLSGFGKPTDDLKMGDNAKMYKISFLKDPDSDQDAATRKYVDTKVSDAGLLNLALNHILVGNAKDKAVAIEKNEVPLSDFGSATTDIVFNKGTNFRITALADPKDDQDAATKKYVDSKTSKTPVGPTAPTNPVAGDTYYNTTDKHFYVYDGTKWVTVDIKTELKTGELFVGDATNTPVSTLKSDVPLSGFGEALKDLAINKGASAFRITALADPKDDQDAATKKYVDSKGTQTSGTAPVNPKAGDTYYNTTDKHLYFYNGTDWIAIDTKDNLGNHKATQNIILGTNSISNDGLNGKGLSFDTNGNATFGQDVTVNANFYTPSDRRLKTNIETLSSVLQKINQIRGVSFQYINQHKYAAGPKIGVIAQELQQVYPEMVTKGKDGFLKVDYTQLTGMLIQAIKEQQQELEILKARMDKQQQQIDSILKRMQ